jgi:peptide/nickel transport system permease protein
VRTALAKGCAQKTVLFKHVLKNAMIPVLTSVVLTIPFLYTGNLLLETFFGVPGLGYLNVEAINSTDYPVIKATVFVGSVLYVFASLLTDICYAMVDPRIKLR